MTRYTPITDPAAYQRMSFSAIDPNGHVDLDSLSNLQDGYAKHGYVAKPVDLLDRRQSRPCGRATVLVALRRLQDGLPFKMLGLDSDSGSEFLNAALVDYGADQHITFTRGRPYRKNDGCFVELCGHPHKAQLSCI